MLLQCHYFQTQCTCINSDPASNCYNECLDENGKRCVWLDGKDCSYFVCNCNYNKRYRKQDTVRISAKIKRRDIVNSNPMICDMSANDQAAIQYLLEMRS